MMMTLGRWAALLLLLLLLLLCWPATLNLLPLVANDASVLLVRIN
jgi:hypothetical protein